MYLFNTNEKSEIEVLRLTPKKEEIKEFKSNELKKIDPDKAFAVHATRPGLKRLENYEKEPVISATVGRDKSIEGLSWNDRISFEKEDKIRSEIKRAYIEEKDYLFTQHGFFMIEGMLKDEHITSLYLMTTEPYESVYKRDQMDNILVITRSLFLLRLFELGKLDLLKNAPKEELKSILELYNNDFETTINPSSIDELIKYGLIEDVKKATENKIQTSQYLLNLRKKN